MFKWFQIIPLLKSFTLSKQLASEHSSGRHSSTTVWTWRIWERTRPCISEAPHSVWIRMKVGKASRSQLVTAYAMPSHIWWCTHCRWRNDLQTHLVIAKPSALTHITQHCSWMIKHIRGVLMCFTHFWPPIKSFHRKFDVGKGAEMTPLTYTSKRE